MSGVPQGSVLGATTLCHLPVHIATWNRSGCTQCKLSSVGYAKDTQLYMAFQPNNGSAALSAVSDCVANVSRWFLQNGLLLNPFKTAVQL